MNNSITWHAFSWKRIKHDARALARESREFLSPPEEAKDPELDFMNPRRVVGTGRSIILVFVLGFFGWAVLAPLQSAIMAPGTIMVESRVKTIQHLEGGIVRDILVNDGQSVKAGQVLVRMDGTQAKANLESLTDQGDALEAQEARLEAQRDGKAGITFPADLMSRAA